MKKWKFWKKKTYPEDIIAYNTMKLPALRNMIDLSLNCHLLWIKPINSSSDFSPSWIVGGISSSKSVVATMIRWTRNLRDNIVESKICCQREVWLNLSVFSIDLQPYFTWRRWRGGDYNSFLPQPYEIEN